MMSSSQRNKSNGSSKFPSVSPPGKFSTSPRSTSPTRITVRNPNSSPSVRFSMTSPQCIMTSSSPKPSWSYGSKKTCLCSPTTHPGSFRCSLHKNSTSVNTTNDSTTTYRSHRLYARRSAMANSLVRIGKVEGGDLVKRALATLIRPSSHQIRRRSEFRPRPSRLSVMSKAGE